jgi:hypothetical protein
LDNESRTPTIPTLDGVISSVDYKNSFIETTNINDINYISEGFLGRYYYKLKQKESGFWKKFGIATAVVAVLAAAVVATIFTCGAAGAAIGAGVATAAAATSAVAAGGALVMGSLVGLGIAAGSAIVVAGVVIGSIEIDLAVRQSRGKKAAQAVNGRKDKIPEGWERSENDESRLLDHDINKRYIIKDPSHNSYSALIIPDYQVNQPYYNQFLTGGDFKACLLYE